MTKIGKQNNHYIELCNVKGCIKEYNFCASLAEIHHHLHDEHDITIPQANHKILNALVRRYAIDLDELIRGVILISRIK